MSLYELAAGGFLAAGARTETVTLSNTTTFKDLSVATGPNDGVTEPPGQISAQLLDGANYALPNNTANSVAHVRVVDEVLPVITVTGVSMTEGDTTRTINFSLDKANGTDQVTINATLATNNTATETEDFTLSTTTVNIPSTGTTGTITVTVEDDAYDEADNEIFVLNLTSTEATFSDRTFSGSVTNTIADNDPLPKVSIEADRFETRNECSF